MFADVLDRRQEQYERYCRATSHLGSERQISILLQWMSIDEVDEMLETVDKRKEEN